MRPLRLLLLSVCFAGPLLLVMGYLYRQHLPTDSDLPTISRFDVRADLTVWTPPREGFQLHDFPPHRPDSFCNNQPDDASARPAWGMLIGLVVLFLYVLGTSQSVIWHLRLW